MLLSAVMGEKSVLVNNEYEKLTPFTEGHTNTVVEYLFQ